MNFVRLAGDTDAIDTVRRALADSSSAAAAQDAELARARTQARPAADTGVKKIVIDDMSPRRKSPLARRSQLFRRPRQLLNLQST